MLVLLIELHQNICCFEFVKIELCCFKLVKTEFFFFQVRMKAVCVLDSIVRKNGDEPFSIVASYFSENNDSLIRCCESPQASLREKANKVSHLSSPFWHFILFLIDILSLFPVYVCIFCACLYMSDAPLAV